jgi:hypothetical protein
MLEMNFIRRIQNATFGMHLKTVAVVLLLSFSMPSFAQSIWTNPITGSDPGMTSPYTTGDVKDANITVSGISRGAALVGNVANNRYNARPWNTGAINPTGYFQFTLTPNAGYRIDFSSFVYTGQASGTGPVNFAFYSDADGFASPIGTVTSTGTTVSLAAALFQNRTVSTTFRFYAWGGSAAGGTFSINDFTFNGSVNATCPSVTLTSVLPTSGPVGTEVTITAASGLTGATATFSGIAASIVSTSATQLVVTVPAGATTGNLVVRNSVSCASTPVAFTVINQDITSCEGNSTFTDLIISEVFDETAGSGGAIELFNPTASAINMLAGNYLLARFTDSTTPVTTHAMTGTIASGATYLVSAVVATPACTGVTYPETLGTGYNANDRFELRKNTSTVLDVAYGASVVGYNAYRNTSAVGPAATYNAADWTISTTPDCSDLGYFPPITKVAPNLVTSPTVSLTCTSTSVTLTAAGSEGHVGGNTLAYQWYYLAPATNVWTAVANNANYSGATTTALTVTPVATFNNYQYYCQIRENGATCYKATNATIIKDTFSTTWTTAWSNGTPSLTKRAIIDGTYNTTTNGSFECCSLTVNATRTLTITALNYVSIQNNLTVNGTLTVQDDGSLVQISNTGVDTGNITINRDVLMKKYDYVYWASPVGGFPVTSVSSGTATNFIYQWQPTQSGNFGTWINANENMATGKGYIIRGAAALPTTLSTFSTSFTGVPNNGILTKGIARGSYQAANYTNPANGMIVTKEDDNWNLVGNPYPSSINALTFLTVNTNIEGAVRLWTHGTLPSSAVSDPFYGNFQYNYNSSDYIVHNGVGTLSGPAGFNGKIASGQAFFVLMNDGPMDNTQSVIFNNSMRDKSYGNDQFYRPGIAGNTEIRENDGDVEKSRIWLDLINADNAVSRTLVGYVDSATLDKDRLYDAYGKLDNSQNFYSLINSEVMAIQGRPIPFDSNDMVPLGMHLQAAGNYKIAIAAIDGVFEQDAMIYLEDKSLGIIHDLKQSPYEFSADSGTMDTRFVLRYTNELLGNSDFDTIGNGVVVATDNHILSVKSYNEPIAEVVVYDMPGRKIFSQNDFKGNEMQIREITARQQTLIVKIKLQNGQIVTRKIVL